MPKTCKSCYNKRFYTQIFGKSFSGDFPGDNSYQEKPKIYKIACPDCNPDNKRKIKDVWATLWQKNYKKPAPADRYDVSAITKELKKYEAKLEAIKRIIEK